MNRVVFNGCWQGPGAVQGIDLCIFCTVQGNDSWRRKWSSLFKGRQGVREGVGDVLCLSCCISAAVMRKTTKPRGLERWMSAVLTGV